MTEAWVLKRMKYLEHFNRSIPEFGIKLRGSTYLVPMGTVSSNDMARANRRMEKAFEYHRLKRKYQGGLVP